MLVSGSTDQDPLSPALHLPLWAKERAPPPSVWYRPWGPTWSWMCLLVSDSPLRDPPLALKVNFRNNLHRQSCWCTFLSPLLVYETVVLSSVCRWCCRRWILSSHSYGRGLFEVRNFAACENTEASLQLIDESFHVSLTSISPVTFTPSLLPTTWWLQPSTLECSTSLHSLTRWGLLFISVR